MLMLTPEFAKARRKESRRERERLRGRLGQNRFGALAGEIARVIRLAFEAGDTGSPFGLEGALRAGIRADLCLAGWRWQTADAMARDLLDEAFRRARAVRPTWYEGQKEWTMHEGLLIERTRCVRCHKSLPAGHRKFCSDLCAGAHHHRLANLRKASEDVAMKIATKSLT